MTALRQRMVNDMMLRGMAEKTLKSYTQAVASLAKYYRRSPDQISHEEVQTYLLHLMQERKLAWSTCSMAVHGLRFFFHTTLGHDAVAFSIPSPRQPSKLPLILSREEVQRLVAAATDRQPHALRMTTYAAGLRVSEAVRLKITDLDAARQTIRVELGKGAKDHSRRACWRSYARTGGTRGRPCGCFPGATAPPR